MDVISEEPAPIRQSFLFLEEHPLSHYFPFKGSLFHTEALYMNRDMVHPHPASPP